MRRSVDYENAKDVAGRLREGDDVYRGEDLGKHEKVFFSRNLHAIRRKPERLRRPLQTVATGISTRRVETAS